MRSRGRGIARDGEEKMIRQFSVSQGWNFVLCYGQPSSTAESKHHWDYWQPSINALDMLDSLSSLLHTPRQCRPRRRQRQGYPHSTRRSTTWRKNSTRLLHDSNFKWEKSPFLPLQRSSMLRFGKRFSVPRNESTCPLCTSEKRRRNWSLSLKKLRLNVVGGYNSCCFGKDTQSTSVNPDWCVERNKGGASWLCSVTARPPRHAIRRQSRCTIVSYS